MGVPPRVLAYEKTHPPPLGASREPPSPTHTYEPVRRPPPYPPPVGASLVGALPRQTASNLLSPHHPPPDANPSLHPFFPRRRESIPRTPHPSNRIATLPVGAVREPPAHTDEQVRRRPPHPPTVGATLVVALPPIRPGTSPKMRPLPHSRMGRFEICPLPPNHPRRGRFQTCLLPPSPPDANSLTIMSPLPKQ